MTRLKAQNKQALKEQEWQSNTRYPDFYNGTKHEHFILEIIAPVIIPL